MDDLYNQRSEVTSRWTGDGTSSEMPRNTVGDSYGNTVFSDRWIEDGSYVRLKNFSLGYTFSKSTKVYKNLQVYVTATNLFTLTNYTGYDPEVSFNYNGSQNSVNRGVDDYGFPTYRTYTVGLKATF